MKRKTMNQLVRVTFLIVLLFTSIALQAKDVEFDFKANPWGLPVAPKFGEPEEGKLDNDVKIEQDGVVITQQKMNNKYWNRLFADGLTIYSKNGITITAPRGFKINGIDFYCVSDFDFDLSTDNEPTIESEVDNDKLYKSKAKGLVLKYKNNTSRTRLTKIIVHLEPNDITGITHQPLNSDVNEIVCSLDGIRVGTTKDFHLLSKGIYIVGRKKVQKY